MLYNNTIWVGTGTEPAILIPEMAMRHGLIAGAPGTGKSLTVKVLAEGFSSLGIPVLISDIKGEFGGLIKPGEHSDKMANRLAQTGVPSFYYRAFPTLFWDAYGLKGHPLRTVIQEMGPMLLGKMLGLNEQQSSLLTVCFQIARHEGMLILDLQDLKAMLVYIRANLSTYAIQYGHISTASIGVILRAILTLEEQGGHVFFGEPAFMVDDWFMHDEEGLGFINIIACNRLYRNSSFYSSYLIWLLHMLYEGLSAAEDTETPRFVLFLDDAHILFRDCSNALINEIEKTIRMIGRKGVGVFLVTDDPSSIPEIILKQLGNRIIHAMRVFTPLQRQALDAVVIPSRTYSYSGQMNDLISLKDGEALISLLQDNGAPSLMQRATILPPQSYINRISDEQLRMYIETSPLFGVYE